MHVSIFKYELKFTKSLKLALSLWSNQVSLVVSFWRFKLLRRVEAAGKLPVLIEVVNPFVLKLKQISALKFLFEIATFVTFEFEITAVIGPLKHQVQKERLVLSYFYYFLIIFFSNVKII